MKIKALRHILASSAIAMVAVGGAFPAKAMWVKEFSQFFIPEVNKHLAAAGNYEIE